MSDGTDAGPPVQDKDALAREKLEREVEELRQAPIRARHAQRMSLYTTILVAALSASTTLIVAYNTYHLNSVAQKTSDESHRQDTYAKLIADLGSENAEARVGAAVGLGPYARDDQERQAQTIAILTTLLTTEKNSQVLQALIPAIVGIGAPAMDRVAELNRYAKQQYVADARMVILPEMGNGFVYSALASKMSSDQVGEKFTQDAHVLFDKLIYGDLQSQIDLGLLTEQERVSLAFVTDDHRQSAGLRTALFSLAAGPLGDLGIVQSGFDDLGVAVDSNDRAQASKRLPDEIRGVYLTGIVLSRLVAAHSDVLAAKDLSRTAMISADFHNVKAEHVNLSGSFLVGDARNADFRNADLSLSDFAYLALADAKLSGALLFGARVGEGDGEVADFTGAPWWTLLRNGGKENADNIGLTISAAHPGMIAGRTRQCSPPEPAITFCAGLSPTGAEFARFGREPPD